MRKITEQSARAFLTGRSLSKANMLVMHNDDDWCMYLHNNLIARKYVVPGGFGVAKSSRIEIMDAGWQSNTTKERLNGLLSEFAPGYGIYQRDFSWYLSTPRDDRVIWHGRAVFTKEGQLIES